MHLMDATQKVITCQKYENLYKDLKRFFIDKNLKSIVDLNLKLKIYIIVIYILFIVYNNKYVIESFVLKISIIVFKKNFIDK